MIKKIALIISMLPLLAGCANTMTSSMDVQTPQMQLMKRQR